MAFSENKGKSCIFVCPTRVGQTNWLINFKALSFLSNLLKSNAIFCKEWRIYSSFRKAGFHLSAFNFWDRINFFLWSFIFDISISSVRHAWFLSHYINGFYKRLRRPGFLKSSRKALSRYVNLLNLTCYGSFLQPVVLSKCLSDMLFNFGFWPRGSRPLL